MHVLLSISIVKKACIQFVLSLYHFKNCIKIILQNEVYENNSIFTHHGESNSHNDVWSSITISTDALLTPH